MLLDQKRTKRTIQVIAVLTSVAFAGVIFVVLGLILFGGGGSTQADEILDDAKALVEEAPNDPDSYEALASAYRGKEDFARAIAAQEKAVALDPRDFSRVQALANLQVESGDTDGVVDTLRNFTRQNPRNAEAFLLLAQQAEDSGRTPLALLSYQAFLRLAPDDANASAVRDRIAQLQRGTAPGSTG